MNSIQYEELCRYFLAQTMGVRVDTMKSIRVPNPKRPDLPEYSHQVDLYWETGNEVCSYINIANAKWRGSDKVDQGDVLLIDSVKQKISAHKAVMITNTEFTSGAEAAAQNSGIALHIVRPEFSAATLHAKDRLLIQLQLSELAATSTTPIFTHILRYRDVDVIPSTKPGSVSPPRNIPATANRVVTGYSTRVVSTPPTSRGSAGSKIAGGFNRGGPSGMRTR
jgi:hypothetical protein